MAAWLSENRVVGAVRVLKTSERRLCSQSTSFMLCITVMYSLSVMDRETSFCHLEDHKTALPSMRNA